MWDLKKKTGFSKGPEFSELPISDAPGGSFVTWPKCKSLHGSPNTISASFMV